MTPRTMARNESPRPQVGLGAFVRHVDSVAGVVSVDGEVGSDANRQAFGAPDRPRQ